MSKRKGNVKRHTAKKTKTKTFTEHTNTTQTYLLHNKRSDALGPSGGVGLCIYYKNIGIGAVCDPKLISIQYPFIAYYGAKKK